MSAAAARFRKAAEVAAGNLREDPLGKQPEAAADHEDFADYRGSTHAEAAIAMVRLKPTDEGWIEDRAHDDRAQLHRGPAVLATGGHQARADDHAEINQEHIRRQDPQVIGRRAEALLSEDRDAHSRKQAATQGHGHDKEGNCKKRIARRLAIGLLILCVSALGFVAVRAGARLLKWRLR